MNHLQLKVGLSLLAIFALGFGTGQLASRRSQTGVAASVVPATNQVAKTGPAERAATRWRTQRLEELRAKVVLSPEQVTAHEELMDAVIGQYRDLKAEMAGRFGAAVAEANKAFAQNLTREQRKAFWEHIRSKAPPKDG